VEEKETEKRMKTKKVKAKYVCGLDSALYNTVAAAVL
jgi:hypothetical protein